MKQGILLCVALLVACAKPGYELADGQRGTFDQWAGQWVVINYWATWCPPCHEEIPELNAFAKTHTAVRVVGVDFEQTQGAALVESIAKMSIEFPVLTRDPAAILQYAPPTVLPATVIINPAGKVHHVLVGPQTQQSLQAAIEEK